MAMGKMGETFTDINVTPLTDVFLVLLVIMILVAPLVNQTVLKVDPPSSGGPAKQQEQEREKIDVHVGANGVVTVNQQNFTNPDSLQIQQAIHNEQMKFGKDDVPLNLASDADAYQKYVVGVMDAAAGAGIKRMRVLPLTQGGAK